MPKFSKKPQREQIGRQFAINYRGETNISRNIPTPTRVNFEQPAIEAAKSR